MKIIITFLDNEACQKELELIKRIGEGKFDVFYAKDTLSNEEYAVKVFPKSDASSPNYVREKSLTGFLDHPNIIKYHSIRDHDADFDILITDFASYGDFFSLVTEGIFEEDLLIRTYFHQLVEGIEYLHSQGIAHLDLKLENLLLSQDFLLKIIDFDQSHTRNEKLITCAGTNGYRAPEIKAKDCHDIFAADIYSLGVILYAFKAHQFPFIEVEENGETKMTCYDLFVNDNQAFWKTKAKKIGKKCSFFSEDFKTILRGMFEKDPSKRITIQGIKASEWYNKPILTSDELKMHMKIAYERHLTK